MTLFIVKKVYEWCKILAEENLGNIGYQNSMVVVALFKIILQ
jgi:hypothetical protein